MQVECLGNLPSSSMSRLIYSQCQTILRMLIGSERKIITFTKATGAEDLPLLCRVLLDGHYCLAEILYASGMGQFIYQISQLFLLAAQEETARGDWNVSVCFSDRLGVEL